MEKIDFDSFIIHERNKLWEDKRKLIKESESTNYLHQPEVLSNIVSQGIDQKVDEFIKKSAKNLENISPNQRPIRTPVGEHYVGALSKHSPFSSEVCRERKSPANDCGQYSERVPPNTLAASKPNTEPTMATMVRFGEYSPLNPNLLSPGKSLLGLGEYEEKRRLLMNRKKQEYREYLAQARLLGIKGSTPTKPNEIIKQTNLFSNAQTNNTDTQANYANNNYANAQKSPVMLANASTNTTPTKSSDYVKLSNILSDWSDRETNPYRQNVSPNFNVNVPLVLTNASTNTTPERITRDVQTDPEWEVGPVRLFATEGNQTVASPGDNLWIEKSSPNNLRNVVVAPNAGTSNVLTYFGESVWAEKVKRHSPVIEAVKFMSPRERKLADLQESGAKSPNKCGSELSPRNDTSPSVMKTQREAYKEELRKQIEEKQRIDAELRVKAKLEEEAIARRVAQQQERMRQEFLKEEAEKKERQAQRLSQMEEFRRRQEEIRKAENARFLRKKPIVVESREDASATESDDPPKRGQEMQSRNERSPAAAQARRAPPPVRKPARQPQHPVLDPRQQRRILAEREEEEEAASPRDGNPRLDDSLPIPVFRAKSPVVPALRTNAEMENTTVAANSKGMKMLEAKWQVPAVQKTNLAPTGGFLGDGSRGCPKTILTQLGAFRRQLQIEQMRMEEIVQQRNQPNIV